MAVIDVVHTWITHGTVLNGVPFDTWSSPTGIQLELLDDSHTLIGVYHLTPHALNGGPIHINNVAGTVSWFRILDSSGVIHEQQRISPAVTVIQGDTLSFTISLPF